MEVALKVGSNYLHHKQSLGLKDLHEVFPIAIGSHEGFEFMQDPYSNEWEPNIIVEVISKGYNIDSGSKKSCIEYFIEVG